MRSSDGFILKTIVIFCLFLYLHIPCFSNVPDKEEKISYGREAFEWGISLCAFGTSFALEKTGPWPDRSLLGGSTGNSYHKDTVSEYWIYGAAGLMTGFICLVPNQNGFFNRTSYTNAKGFIQALAFTTLTTSLTKDIFARKRPSYDNYPPDEREKDGRKSFISGHSAASFCIATYGSMFIYSTVGDRDNSWHMAGKIISAAGLYSFAGLVAWSRVNDNRHHVSDVVAGGLAGSAIAAIVFLFHNGTDSLVSHDNDADVVMVSTGDVTRLGVSRCF